MLYDLVMKPHDGNDHFFHCALSDLLTKIINIPLGPTYLDTIEMTLGLMMTWYNKEIMIFSKDGFIMSKKTKRYMILYSNLPFLDKRISWYTCRYTYSYKMYTTWWVYFVTGLSYVLQYSPRLPATQRQISQTRALIPAHLVVFIELGEDRWNVCYSTKTPGIVIEIQVLPFWTLALF